MNESRIEGQLRCCPGAVEQGSSCGQVSSSSGSVLSPATQSRAWGRDPAMSDGGWVRRIQPFVIGTRLSAPPDPQDQVEPSWSPCPTGRAASDRSCSTGLEEEEEEEEDSLSPAYSSSRSIRKIAICRGGQPGPPDPREADPRTPDLRETSPGPLYPKDTSPPDPGPLDPREADPGTPDLREADPGTPDHGPPRDTRPLDPGPFDPKETGTPDPRDTRPPNPGPLDPRETDPGPHDPREPGRGGPRGVQASWEDQPRLRGWRRATVSAVEEELCPPEESRPLVAGSGVEEEEPQRETTSDHLLSSSSLIVKLALDVSSFYQTADGLLATMDSKHVAELTNKEELEELTLKITMLDQRVICLSEVHPTLASRLTQKQTEVRDRWHRLLERRSVEGASCLKPGYGADQSGLDVEYPAFTVKTLRWLEDSASLAPARRPGGVRTKRPFRKIKERMEELQGMLGWIQLNGWDRRSPGYHSNQLGDVGRQDGRSPSSEAPLPPHENLHTQSPVEPSADPNQVPQCLVTRLSSGGDGISLVLTFDPESADKGHDLMTPEPSHRVSRFLQVSTVVLPATPALTSVASLKVHTEGRGRRSTARRSPSGPPQAGPPAPAPPPHRANTWPLDHQTSDGPAATTRPGHPSLQLYMRQDPGGRTRGVKGPDRAEVRGHAEGRYTIPLGSTLRLDLPRSRDKPAKLTSEGHSLARTSPPLVRSGCLKTCLSGSAPGGPGTPQPPSRVTCGGTRPVGEMSEHVRAPANAPLSCHPVDTPHGSQSTEEPRSPPPLAEGASTPGWVPGVSVTSDQAPRPSSRAAAPEPPGPLELLRRHICPSVHTKISDLEGHMYYQPKQPAPLPLPPDQSGSVSARPSGFGRVVVCSEEEQTCWFCSGPGQRGDPRPQTAGGLSPERLPPERWQFEEVEGELEDIWDSWVFQAEPFQWVFQAQPYQDQAAGSEESIGVEEPNPDFVFNRNVPEAGKFTERRRSVSRWLRVDLQLYRSVERSSGRNRPRDQSDRWNHDIKAQQASSLRT
ncbi:unnamed protein product [Arctogadus glacialis]